MRFAPLDPQNWEFDVYRNLDSGAMFITPANTQLEPLGGDLRIKVGNDTGVNMFIRFGQHRDHLAVQKASEQFELDLATHSNQAWTPNPVWSYIQPITYPSGLTVRRKSFIVPQPIPPGITKYLLETFASMNNQLLSVAALDKDYPKVFLDSGHAVSWGRQF